jgi:hypothetical protein
MDKVQNGDKTFQENAKISDIAAPLRQGARNREREPGFADVGRAIKLLLEKKIEQCKSIPVARPGKARLQPGRKIGMNSLPFCRRLERRRSRSD